jgi:hypothetical protein
MSPSGGAASGTAGPSRRGVQENSGSRSAGSRLDAAAWSECGASERGGRAARRSWAPQRPLGAAGGTASPGPCGRGSVQIGGPAKVSSPGGPVAQSKKSLYV